MENVGAIVISAVLSGLLATVVTLWWQNKAELKREKNQIFKTLMAKRYEVSSEDCVNALNLIDVVFYSSDTVRAAYKEYLNATNLPDAPNRANIVNDKHLRLLEVIAEEIGYKEIKWENIKNYYYPLGLSELKSETAQLRKLQIKDLSHIKDRTNQETV